MPFVGVRLWVFITVGFLTWRYKPACSLFPPLLLPCYRHLDYIVSVSQVGNLMSTDYSIPLKIPKSVSHDGSRISRLAPSIGWRHAVSSYVFTVIFWWSSVQDHIISYPYHSISISYHIHIISYPYHIISISFILFGRTLWSTASNASIIHETKEQVVMFSVPFNTIIKVKNWISRTWSKKITTCSSISSYNFTFFQR